MCDRNIVLYEWRHTKCLKVGDVAVATFEAWNDVVDVRRRMGSLSAAQLKATRCPIQDFIST